MKLVYFFLLSIVVISCQNQGKMDIQAAKKATVDSMKVVNEKQRVIDSMKLEIVKIEEAKIETKKEVIVVNQQAPSSTTTTTTTKKQGWSNTAKGAVIGAGVGAATGAIISKKKVQGAIIGGVAGAGVGAGTGAILDAKKKKD
ncbi:hypothetical protein RCH18_002885 [Flavobacterium sp. PL11]|jgi:hypothetical protein|uniref:YMGG-like glycine zipper-containing protein n=1 Tax=Flavobacterium sp. PL11 TaxID=3071717 RepID=UPI002DF9FE30|nr:hypothetical protein [Flavobacterium sp. PL11]